jgi:hypothetical protein
MINETNQIIEHVFVDISRSQGCKNTTCQNEKIVYFSRVKSEQRKEKKRHHQMSRWYLGTSVGVWVRVLGTLRKAQVSWHRRMNRWSNSYMCRMIGRSKAVEVSSTGRTDGPVGSTVDLSDVEFESTRRRAKIDSVAPDEPKPWSEEASVYPMVTNKLTVRFWWGVLQHQMNRRTVGV